LINIQLIQNIDLKGSTLIEGFPGVGLVGPMAISYITEKLNLKYIGYIESNDFPPIVSIHESKPLPPVRIYYSEKYNLVSVFAEFVIPINLVHELSEKLFEFVNSKGVGKIISIGGIPGKDPQTDMAYVIASTPELLKEAEKAGLNPIIEGISTGVSALLLAKATTAKILDTNVLVPVDPSIIDPKYAELAIKNINKLLKLDVDTNELEKEAKEVEAKVRDLMKKSRETHETYKKSVNPDEPSMYA
jgi:uncharacterized protein